MPLTPSPRCRARIAQNPTPLRTKFGCSNRDWSNPRPLKARIEEWVSAGQPSATLKDLLRVTPAAVHRLLEGWPTVVVTEPITDLTPAIDAVAAPEGKFPRFIVVPNQTCIGDFADQFERCAYHGIVIVHMREVELFSSLLPR